MTTSPEAGAPGAPEPQRTVVHLLRHGEVRNPHRILYGRLDGYHLSALGREMADLAAEHLGDHDITHVVSSPLERARETAAPIAEEHGLEVGLDRRSVINCDGLHTIAQTTLTSRVGEVDVATLERVCSAVSYALGF